ncbi:TIGR01777 family protein [candidate division GN15 bacterium]|uniref:TIGR01777 family protein n=1 Tax=candidate division GN15 bacterium TaxID=2072418 RepID=A0A855XDE5_9BACT|nr:MAG: TIGR01777 family protein [candidate division GN15 bacterium]
MRILITGARGLIGTALVERLTGAGHDIVTLTRSDADTGRGHYAWNPETGECDIRALRAVDVIVHLAGENIGARRWTPEQKRRLRDSRIKSTALLVDTISRLDHRPRVLVSASAVGYYGNRGDELLTETSAPGGGFLSDLCRDWEAEAMKAMPLGLRVVCTRTGMVLSRHGGTLERLFPMFRIGLGGSLGSGNQYWSWITLQDAVRAIEFAITGDRITGPVNVVSPNPVTNAEFTKSLARVLHRPAIFPVPAPILRLALGEMADSLVLAGQRAVAARLTDAGFCFEHPDLSSAFRAILG